MLFSCTSQKRSESFLVQRKWAICTKLLVSFIAASKRYDHLDGNSFSNLLAANSLISEINVLLLFLYTWFDSEMRPILMEL